MTDFTLQIPFADFRELATVGSIASTDPARPILTGVLVEQSAGFVRFVATDSYRLAYIDREVATLEGDASAIVPAEFLARAVKTLTAALKRECGRLVPACHVLLVVAGDSVSACVDLAFVPDTVIARLVSGDYPAYRSLKIEGDKVETGAAFNPSFLADLTKLAPWATMTLKERDSANGSVVTRQMSMTTPARFESVDGRTVYALMPVKVA